jgi:hypothetical protein
MRAATMRAAKARPGTGQARLPLWQVSPVFDEILADAAAAWAEGDVAKADAIFQLAHAVVTVETRPIR